LQERFQVYYAEQNAPQLSDRKLVDVVKIISSSGLKLMRAASLGAEMASGLEAPGN
jgi:hypothetical protein